MDANPVPTAKRLQRAERLVAQAAGAGAQLVVLPELFNTGYAYSEENYHRAEPIHGQTVTWLRDTAARHTIHLAGSLLLVDQNEIYNALLLLAPDGRTWRYDKNYPWAWERNYFRQGHGVTVAQTDLGDLGMLICWDVAHPNLWRQYAGQVDMMLISSCPPDFSDVTYHFPTGEQFTLNDLRLLGSLMPGTGRLVFGDMLNQQTAWLQVPAANTVGTGHIRTKIPNGLISLVGMVPLAPRLARYLPQANHVQASCDFVPGCKVVDAQGQTLTQLAQAQGETFTTAGVTLADQKPLPDRAQPKSPLPKLAYYFSDTFTPLISIPAYRRGVRRAL
jgi:hypothetical protein